MSDLALGPVIGKLGGGAEVHSIPVDFTSPSGTGTYHVVDVPVPEGVTARVMVVGTSKVEMASGSDKWPRLIIGGQEIGRYFNSVGCHTTVTGPTALEARRMGTTSYHNPSFVGTVYWWEEASNE